MILRYLWTENSFTSIFSILINDIHLIKPLGVKITILRETVLISWAEIESWIAKFKIKYANTYCFHLFSCYNMCIVLWPDLKLIFYRKNITQVLFFKEWFLYTARGFLFQIIPVKHLKYIHLQPTTSFEWEYFWLLSECNIALSEKTFPRLLYLLDHESKHFMFIEQDLWSCQWTDTWQ